jgi:hypothetical protein
VSGCPGPNTLFVISIACTLNPRPTFRGWTLQELIAPEIVEFFAKEGKILGNKTSLEMPIHEITGIPVKALQGNPFSDFNIGERREWAANRQTTEQEDLVYCLLGLCEVSMPPIYGEGKEAALKRFQMTVRGFSNSSGPKDPKGTSCPNFTGRETRLVKLEENVFEQGQTTKLAIIGLGVVGKTQLLLELVHRIRDTHKNCSII